MLKRYYLLFMIYIFFIYLQAKMYKKNSQRGNKERHKFEMIGNSQTYFDKITVNFQPQRQNSSSESSSQDSYSKQRSQQQYYSIIPTYNNDRKTFTPSFYIPYSIEPESYYEQKHNKRINKYQQISQDKILVPKPRKKDYCHVCQNYFDDYLEHIGSQQHSKRIRKNAFQKHIDKLISKLKKNAIKKDGKQQNRTRSRITIDQN